MLRSLRGHFFFSAAIYHDYFIEETNGERRYGRPLDLARWDCFHRCHAVGMISHAMRATTASCRVEGIGNRVGAQVVSGLE